MKRLFIILISLTVAFSLYSQDYLKEGYNCFNSGTYSCAITNFTKALNSLTGREQKEADIMLGKAKLCDENLKLGNHAFSSKNYREAKTYYEKILISNPKDSHAMARISECDGLLKPMQLRTATNSDLKDIWDNKYGSQPERRRRLIAAGIDPDDAQRRINRGEGKPTLTTSNEKPSYSNSKTTLFVSNTTVTMNVNGGRSEIVYATTNIDNYTIPNIFLPWWIKVEQHKNYFYVIFEPNNKQSARKDWFIVKAGDEEIKVNVEQYGSTNNSTANQNYSSTKLKKHNRANFNSPKGNYSSWGISLGYSELYPGAGVKSPIYLVGIKYQPEFKYGFGLNFGLNYEKYNDYEHLSGSNISLSGAFQYNFNISKWFAPYIHSGATLNFNTNEKNYDDRRDMSTFIDFGIGAKIGRIQIDITNSMLFDTVKDKFDIGAFYDSPDKLLFKLSYML